MTPRGSQPGGPDAPAVNVTANEAAAFSEKVFGGRLPTPAEWDHAAGLRDHQQDQRTVTLPSGSARLDRTEPAPTHGPEAGTDVNVFGLRDTAGNGREWTRAVLPGRSQPLRFVDGPNFVPGALVIFRGRDYTLSDRLTFEMLTSEAKDPQQTQFADKPTLHTGFRVVVPVP